MRLIFLLSLCFIITIPAQAGSKTWPFGWPQGHYKEPRFEPYINDAKTPHTERFLIEQWTPLDWAQDRGSYTGVLHDFYQEGVITDRYFCGDVPILEVGDTFMMLSDQDKRRVAIFVDEMFGMTFRPEYGFFRIVNARYDEIVGVYSASGLQLQ